MKSEKKTAVLFSYVNSILSILVNIFWGPFLIHTLGAAEYGVYQMVASFAGYLVLMNFGTGTVMTRYVSIYREKKEEKEQQNFIAMALSITLLLAGLIIGIGIFLYQKLGSLYATLNAAQLMEARIIYWFVVANIVTTLLYQAFDGMIMAYEKYMFAQIWQFVKTILRVVLVASLIQWKPNAAFICIVDLLLSFIYLIISIVYCVKKLKIKWKLYKWNVPLLREIFLFSSAIFLQAFVNQVNNNVDKTLLGAMVSPESVSMYSLAMSIYTIFSTLSTALLGLYLPQFTRIVAQCDEPVEITKAAVVPSRIQFVISTTVLFGFILCGRDFVLIWAGKEYMPVWTIALIVMVPMYFVYLTGIVVSILDALGKRLFRSIVLALAAVGNVLISIHLIRRFGMIGAPIGTAISTVIFSVVLMNGYYQFKLKLHIDYLLKESMRGIWKAEIVSFIIVVPLAWKIPCGWIGLLVKGTTFVVALVIGLYTFGLTKVEKNAVKEKLKF